MKNIQKTLQNALAVTCFTAAGLLASCAKTPTQDAHTVIVLLEAKQGKEKELNDALVAVIEPSRSEAASIEYRLHQSKDNPAEFALYENWKSASEHAKQFEKPYIKQLGVQLGNLLAKPYVVFMGHEIKG